MDIRPNTAGSPETEATFGSQNASPNTSGALGDRTISTLTALTASPLTSPKVRVAHVSYEVSLPSIKAGGEALATQNENGNGHVGSEFLADREFTMAPPNEGALAAFFGISDPNQNAFAAFFGGGASELEQISDDMNKRSVENPVQTVLPGINESGQQNDVLLFSATRNDFQVGAAENLPTKQISSYPLKIQLIISRGQFISDDLSAIVDHPEHFLIDDAVGENVVSKEAAELTPEEIKTMSATAAVRFKPTDQFLMSATANKNHGKIILDHVNMHRQMRGLLPLEPEQAFTVVSDEEMKRFFQGWAKDLEKQIELQKEDAKKTNEKKPELKGTEQRKRIAKDLIISTETKNARLSGKLDSGREVDLTRKSLNDEEEKFEKDRIADAKKRATDQYYEEKGVAILNKEKRRFEERRESKNFEEKRNQENQ